MLIFLLSPWTWEELDSQLKKIMKNIHSQCVRYGSNGPKIDYVKEANLSAFIKVTDAMRAYGTV